MRFASHLLHRSVASPSNIINLIKFYLLFAPLPSTPLVLWFDSQGEKSRRTFFWQQRNVFEALSFRHFSLPSPYRSLPEGERDMKILYSSQRQAFARKDEKATSDDCEVQAKTGSVRWRWWQRRENELDLVGQSQVILFSLEHIRSSQVSVLDRQVQKDNRFWKSSVAWSFTRVMSSLRQNFLKVESRLQTYYSNSL